MSSHLEITVANASAYTIPTDAPEADGTFAWSSTTMVVIELEAGGRQGLGYTYAAARPLRHVEYFHDHARIESTLFDGFRKPRDGQMQPDLSRAGLGLDFKHADAERFRDDL